MTKPSSAAAACPICGKPAAEKYRPFCSSRCKNVDLHRWLGEVYTVPVADGEDDEADSIGAPEND